MSSIYDFATVVCFLAVVCAFYFLTDRSQKFLLHLMVSAIAFAVANQLGNAGYGLFAAVLIAAGAGYAFLTIRR